MVKIMITVGITYLAIGLLIGLAIAANAARSGEKVSFSLTLGAVVIFVWPLLFVIGAVYYLVLKTPVKTGKPHF